MARNYWSQERSRKVSDPPREVLEAVIPNPKGKLLDQVREVMRLRHYSIRTEQSYCDWIRRYIKFHHMTSREELAPDGPKVEMFLSDLAVNGRVAASSAATLSAAVLPRTPSSGEQTYGRFKNCSGTRMYPRP